MVRALRGAGENAALSWCAAGLVGCAAGITLTVITLWVANSAINDTVDLIQNRSKNRTDENKNNNCELFYRGDDPGKKEFWARVRGPYGKMLLEETPASLLMSNHAGGEEESPYISLTTDIRVAKHFANSTGEVYKIYLPKGMAFHNPYNTINLPNTNILESEWLVPLHIPSKYVNNPNCDCE